MTTDIPTHAAGPLAEDELRRLLDGPWSQGGIGFLSRCWNADADPDSLAAVVTQDSFPLDLSALSARERAVLGQLLRRGGRLRGETLRRELLLHGFGDLTEDIRALLSRGAILALPAPAEHQSILDEVIHSQEFLQRELALPASLFQAAEAMEREEPLVETPWESVDADDQRGTVEDLELNLLHLSSLIRRDPLKINKDGTPNRRNLQRAARGISMPGIAGEVAADLDLHDAQQLDYLTFLVSLARELQLLMEVDDTYRTNEPALQAFFQCAGAERDRRLLDGVQRLRFWNEIDSLRLDKVPVRTVDDSHFSQHRSTGQPLIGARGFIVSVLRRAHLTDWISLDALVELCTGLDRQYLARSLSQLPGPPEPEEFITAVIRRTLIWAGLLKTGRTDTGVDVLQITRRGARALGLHSDPDHPVQGGCLIVQPNLEVMVFLDNAPVGILHELYRVGDRRKLSDRVATFQLTTESVQRGYALGSSADDVLKVLSDMGHTPVPDSVAFQLQDWERVHRQVSVYIGGIALRHPDPEAFDLICGQLQHDLRDSDAELIRLGARDAFVTDARDPAVERALSAQPSVRLDALGEPPRCLHFVDPLVLLVDPYEWDVFTAVELPEIADVLEEDSSPRATFFELNIDKIRRRFPDDPLAALRDFLDPRCPGGLPPAQSFRLRAELTKPASYHVATNVVVLTFTTELDADTFAELPEAEDLVDRRLGPTTFTVHPKHLALLDELVEELGLQVLPDPPD